MQGATSPTPTRQFVVVFVLLLLTLLPLPCWAHGLGGAALNVLVYRADQPQAVRLTTGLAIARDGRWFYVCDTLWEGIDQPPMAAAEGFPVWVAGADRAYTVDAFGEVRATDVMGVNAGTTLALVSQQEAVWALTQEGEVGTLWRLDASGQGVAIRMFNKPWSSLAATSEHVVMAGAFDGALHVEVMATDGTILRQETVAAMEGGLIAVHGVGSQVLIRINDGFENTWFRLEETGVTRVLSSAPTLEGPGGSPSDVLFVLNGTLVTLIDGRLNDVDDDPSLDCLTYQSGLSVGCAVPDLVRVSAQGIGERVFETASIEPPILNEISETRRLDCQLDWVHFAGEASLPVEPTSPPPPREPTMDMEDRADTLDTMERVDDVLLAINPASSDCACHVRTKPEREGHGMGWPLVFLVLALALGRRQC